MKLTLRLLALVMLPLIGCAAPWRSDPPTSTPAPAMETARPLPQPTDDSIVVPVLSAPAPATFVDLMAQAPDSFNPVLTTSRTALTVQRLFLPSLVTLDPESGAVRPALAENWQWASDNRTLTLTISSGLSWSDGAPLTSRDAAFTLLAVGAPEVQSPWAAQFSGIEQISLPEPDTLVLRQRAPDCALLPMLALPLLPSHLFAGDFSDIRSAAWNSAPAVGAGPFEFAAGALGGELTFEPNRLWPVRSDALDSLIVRVEPDVVRRRQAVVDGEAQRVWGLLPESPQTTPELSVQPVAADGFSMLIMNLADPLAPQPGIAPSGVLEPQAPHPILAELNVREAIARGVDWAALVREVYGVSARPQASWLPPSVGWAHDSSVALPQHDVQAAALLLEQAGWVDAGGDGQRERGDQLLQLTLITNDDNPQRVAMAQRLGELLRPLGFVLRVEVLPFDSLQQAVLAQIHDLAIVGWEELGPDPAGMDFWHSRGDLPGSGPNLTSYQNPALDALLDEARSVPGCDSAARAERYRTVQQVLAAELPAIPLNTQVQWQAVEAGWQGIPASIWNPYAGVESWQPPAMGEAP